MNTPVKIFVIAVGIGAAFATSFATEVPAWAFAVVDSVAASSPDDGTAKHVPDSTVALTRAQITAVESEVPDWHPEEHPAMPSIVGKGRAPKAYACAYCHLPNGAGRPENTSLAGLPFAYIKQQVLAFRNGGRPGSEPRRAPQAIMINAAKTVTDAELAEAAAYFASLKPATYVKVIETATVPKTVVAGWTLIPAPGGGTEPIGNRIIEMPEDFERFELRDSRTPYVAYVPVGSLQRGADLVTNGGDGKTQLCATCHGADLRGLLDVPRLAGRSPSFLMRQLFDLKHHKRTGGISALMQPVIANLTEEDMVAIVAYLASREP